jgi:hypothetical protein
MHRSMRQACTIGSSKDENLKLRKEEGKDRSTGQGRSYIDPCGSRARFTDRCPKGQLPVRAFTAWAVTIDSCMYIRVWETERHRKGVGTSSGRFLSTLVSEVR